MKNTFIFLMKKLNIVQILNNKTNAVYYGNINVDLQIFADSSDKTEKATSKKREDVRKKGQVLQSKELASAILLLSLFYSIKFFAGFMYIEIESYWKRVITEYYKYDNLFEIPILAKLFYDTVITMLKTVGPIFAVAIIVSTALGYAQVGFLFTVETLGMKFSRINPFSGLKRMFSINSIVELFKSILKVAFIGTIGYLYIKGQIVNLFRIGSMELKDSALLIWDMTITTAIRMCFGILFLGIADYLYQWWKFEKDIKMSKQEIKEEYKQQEGNPEIKSKIKQKQRQMSMQRMMQEVPKADVVITNPTHFAVAIKYDSKKSEAPYVLAKGQDFMAKRIKEIAKENKVQIVENKPLARNLYSSVDVGQTIPPELYQAVAEILAFVYGLKK